MPNRIRTEEYTYRPFHAPPAALCRPIHAEVVRFPATPRTRPTWKTRTVPIVPPVAPAVLEPIRLAPRAVAATPRADFEVALLELMPLLRSFAVKLCGRNDADDMCQATLIKAWQAEASFERGTNLKAWVFAILRNHFYSEKRRTWRQSPWDDSLAERSSAPSQSAAAEMSDVVRAMHALPRAQREALILVGLGGYDYREAAAMAGHAVGTMKSRVGRARAALLTALDGSQPLPLHGRPPSGEAMNEILAQLQSLAPAPARPRL